MEPPGMNSVVGPQDLHDLMGLIEQDHQQLHDSIVDYTGQTLTHIEELDRPLRAFLRANPA